MKKKSHYIIILAGGKGERLWPLSREKKPKQLLSIGSELSLLEQTVYRVLSLVDKSHLFIMTTEQQVSIINQLIGPSIGGILTEPCGRNTAPALLLSCLEIHKKDENATIGFLPADHFILQNALFRKNFKQALNFSQNNNVITLLGIKPDFAATGYGYIEHENKKNDSDLQKIRKVTRFHEKPSLEIAKLYRSLPNMLWNIGVFCGKTSLFINEFKKNAPTLFETMMKYYYKKGRYQDCESISFDHAVLEKSKNIFVVSADFSWSDVGNLDVFLSLCTKYKNRNYSVITINSKNNVIEVSKKLVALIGIEDLCIVETDDVLLISKRKQTDNVKLILNKLRAEKQTDYL